MSFVTLLLSIYSLVVLFRIIITWVRGANLGRAEEIIGSIVDPYLNWFRRFTFLRIGAIDLSVIAAIITLSIVTGITAELAITARISIGIILSIIILRVLGAALFFLTIFLILSVIRLLGIFFQANTANRFWIVIDQIVQPMVHAVVYRIVKDRALSYRNALIIFSVLLLAVVIIGRIATPFIGVALRRIPI
jgi:YggT family protein